MIEMKIYRRKPNTIKAVQIDEDDWYQLGLDKSEYGRKGDYILTEPNGNKRLIAKANFEAEYEPMTEGSFDCLKTIRELIKSVESLSKKIEGIEIELQDLKEKKKKGKYGL